MAYVGLMVGGAKGDYIELSALGGIFSDKTANLDLNILDTSVIIDGRIADVAETGFLTGTLIILQFILRELQQVADSPDSSKLYFFLKDPATPQLPPLPPPLALPI